MISNDQITQKALELRKKTRFLAKTKECVIVKLLDDSIVLWNEEAEHVFSFPAAKVEGKRESEVMRLEPSDRAAEDIQEEVLEKGSSFNKYTLYTRRGELRFFTVSSLLVTNTKNEPLGILNIARDITEQRAAESELRAARATLSDLRYLKSNFLANMSHELRTPLNGILGFTQMMMEDADEQSDQYDMLTSILTSGKRLLHTLNLILNLSRLQDNKVTLDMNIESLPEIISEEVKEFEPLCRDKGLFIKMDIHDRDLQIHTDKNMMRDIVRNLLNNAVKFTDHGGITVDVGIEEGISHDYAFFSVRDTGIGIKPEKVNLIFEEFRQVSEGRNRNFEGTGLGLSITKKFVEYLEGEISVNSMPDMGTTFKVRFPVFKEGDTFVEPKKMQKKKPAPIPSPPPVLKNVLLVEDDQMNIDLIRFFLQGFCKLDIARNAATAMEMVNKKRYSAILMDINLGRGDDGMEAAKAIRELEGYENVPIVAQTAFAMPEDKEEFLFGGCSHYLPKPFSRKALIDLVLELTG